MTSGFHRVCPACLVTVRIVVLVKGSYCAELVEY